MKNRVLCFAFQKNYVNIKVMKSREKFDFKNFVKARKKFVSSHKKESFVILDGENNFMLSVPHAVEQVRLGRRKVAEPGTLSLALALKEKANLPIIAKTACMDDDANFDLLCPYRHKLKEYVDEHKIKYLIDVHSLAETREQDINLGVNFGMNIAPDEALFDFMYEEFAKEGFKVFVDQPFNGGIRTISSFISKECGIWTMQLEVNCKFLRKEEYSQSLQKIIDVLVRTIDKTKEKFMFRVETKPKKKED